MNSSKFHTVVDIPAFNWQTGYTTSNLFMGSCFTENIGTRMADLKYRVDNNPFGILYNPVSVASALRFLMNKKEFTEPDLVHYGGLWHSFSHHGSFSASSPNETLENVNRRINTSSAILQKADFLFITFGTAFVYRYKRTGQPVSNCHKISASEFLRERLLVDEIVNDYRNLFTELLVFNPQLKVIFTVSPIRHWGDGAIENQRSKAVLLLAIDKITGEWGDDFCAYFPAYELVMDELRDYRFYSPDMIHISDVAIDFIWEKFESALIDADSRKLAKRVFKIVQAANHRPLHKNSNEYSRFLQQTIDQINILETEIPYLNLSAERLHFEAESNNCRTS